MDKLEPHRGAATNATNRYERFSAEACDDGWDLGDEELPPLKTEVAVDATRTIITRNSSPDVPFDRSINPYRGCEHGCIYCFARPTHAYLGLSPGLDFETRLLAKPDAPALLEKELRNPRYRPAVIAIGTNTDPYQPIERSRRIMRGVLEVLAAFRHPVMITTKSALVARDIDLLAPMAEQGLASVAISVTTLDRDLCRRLEPRAATPAMRLDTIRRLSSAGIPTTVMAAPMIPALTEHELESILEAAHAVGATGAATILLRLPGEVAELFAEWLEQHAPAKAAHIMSLLSQSRGGKAYDSNWGTRFSGTGNLAELLSHRFRLASKRLGLADRHVTLDCSKFRPPPKAGDQLALF
ncbi:MAG TPA: PA0069 family radical SAM protein [Magnetospirillum sp.]|jgi:DNA repair photolyase|nr:PA0069 family radical SAM protein [Magnetospirillum sp.]